MNGQRIQRRTFLAGTGAAIATLPAVSAAASSAGDNTLCIDCQSHIFVPELVRYMERRKEPPYIYSNSGDRFMVVGKWHRRLVAEAGDVSGKLAAMDEAGIDLTALSTNDPGAEQFGKEAPRVARLVHDYLSEIARRHPGRFLPLAALPLNDMEAAMDELDRCVSKLGMKGVLLYSNIAGTFPDEPQFRPLFQRAEELDLPILLHPPYPVTFDQTQGYNLTGGLGLMFDTTIALCRLILSGIFDRHPKLKLVCPHVGGTLPYLIGRINHQVHVLKRAKLDLEKSPTEYLKMVYLDAVNVLPEVIRFGYDMVGSDRML
jgi:predicted TIM-barrel fold metal-dependent hydrolase